MVRFGGGCRALGFGQRVIEVEAFGVDRKRGKAENLPLGAAK